MGRKTKDPSSGDLTDDQAAARFWKSELDRATKVFKNWQDRGDKIVQRYRDERNRTKQNQRRFNILWSNVQTLKPAVFAKQPKPVIERRFKTEDEVERLASQIMERSVSVELDLSGFMPAADKAVLDYLLPGRGVAWIRYEAEFNEPEQDEDPADLDDEADEAEGENSPELAGEYLCLDYVDRKDFLHDPCRTWEEVRWLARRSWLSKRQVTDKFGEEIAGKLTYKDMKVDNDNKNTNDADVRPMIKRAELWQIWDKPRKKVWVVSPSYDGVCDSYDDPLKLRDFWPCPKPLFATLTNDSLVPVPDYAEYQDQAEEIDDLTKRIDKLTQAIKAVGVYDASQPALKRLLTEGVDNMLIPCETWAVLKDKGGLQGSVELFPLDMLIKTLTVLYEARDKSQQALFEITGMSDIVRGQAQGAKATATEQRIKGQFATLRLQDRQRAVAEFCRDIMRIMAELIAEHYSPETLAEMTGLAKPDQIQRMGIQALTPQQPQPPQEVLFMQAIELIKDDKLRSFKIDVEADSLIEPDLAQERQDRTEFVQGAAQFLTAAVPLVQAQPILAPIVGQLLLFGARGFKSGRELESTIESTVRKLDDVANNALNNPQPQVDPEQQKVQGELQLEAQRIQGDQQLAATKHRDEMQLKLLEHHDNMALDAQKQQQEGEMAQRPMTGDPNADLPGIQQAVDEHMNNGRQQIMDMVAQHVAAQKAKNSPEAVLPQMQQMMQQHMQANSQAMAMMSQSQTQALMQIAQAMKQATDNLVQVAQLMSAPKVVIRDQDGKALGVAPDTGGMLQRSQMQ